MDRLTDDDIAHAVARVEEALASVDDLPPLASAALTDAVSALVDLYGEGLTRIVEHTAAAAPALLDQLAEDQLLSHLLLVHDLHPTMTADDMEMLDVSAPVQPDGPTSTFIPVDAVGVRSRT